MEFKFTPKCINVDVIFNGDLNYTAGIDLCLSGDRWEVKTAEPRKTEDIIKRKLLWEK